MKTFLMNSTTNLPGNQELNCVVNFGNNTIEIKDVIGPSGMSSKHPSLVTPEAINGAMESMNGDLTIVINSKGGFVGPALDIYHSISKYAKGVTNALVTGYAFSSAGWVALAAKNREIVNGGVFMMHNPQLSGTFGSDADFEAGKSEYKANREAILNIFEERVENLTREELSTMMENTTYLSASDAVSKGFFHKIHDAKADLKVLNFAAPADLPEEFREAAKETANIDVDDLRNRYMKILQKRVETR